MVVGCEGGGYLSSTTIDWRAFLLLEVEGPVKSGGFSRYKATN